HVRRCPRLCPAAAPPDQDRPRRPLRADRPAARAHAALRLRRALPDARRDEAALSAGGEPDHYCKLTATGTIKGRVIDKRGRPAAHGNVSIEPPGESRDRLGQWGGSANTQPDGSFQFDNVPPGEYVVSAVATNPGPALKGKDLNAKTIMVKAG